MPAPHFLRRLGMKRHKAEQDEQVWSQGQLGTIEWLPGNLVPFPRNPAVGRALDTKTARNFARSSARTQLSCSCLEPGEEMQGGAAAGLPLPSGLSLFPLTSGASMANSSLLRQSLSV